MSGWVCEDEECDWSSGEDELTAVVRHEVENPGHEVHPEVGL